MNTRSKSLSDRFHNWQIVPKDTKYINKANSFTYRSAIKYLQEEYFNPKSGVSFGGVSRVYNFHNKVMSMKEIKKFLSKDNSYTLHTKSFKNDTIPHSTNIKINKCKLI